MPLTELGVDRWHHDLWFEIIRAALAGHPEEVDLSYRVALATPAMSRYAAATPELLSWFKRYNEGRTYSEQVKPFNFMGAFQAKPATLHVAESASRGGHRAKSGKLRPVAPYERNPLACARAAFDREMGHPVSMELLATYQGALAQFHLSPERKFQNGDFVDSAWTVRRYVVLTDILHVGKEANRWEEQSLFGLKDGEIEYGCAYDTAIEMRIRHSVEQHGERKMARRLGIARMTLRKVLLQGLLFTSRAVRNQCAAS